METIFGFYIHESSTVMEPGKKRLVSLVTTSSSNNATRALSSADTMLPSQSHLSIAYRRVIIKSKADTAKNMSGTDFIRLSKPWHRNNVSSWSRYQLNTYPSSDTLYLSNVESTEQVEERVRGSDIKRR